MVKLPKKVIIGGQVWKVVFNKKKGGGQFSGKNNLIQIGGQIPQNVPSIFLHEVIEAILTERDCRYDQYGGMDGNEDFLFNFTHKEFIQVVKDIELAIKDIICK